MVELLPPDLIVESILEAPLKPFDGALLVDLLEDFVVELTVELTVELVALVVNFHELVDFVVLVELL